jgi:phosphate transport system substrate-binding protein
MSKTRGWLRVAGVLLLAAGMPAVGASPARASGPTIVGAGSTWVQIALDQWRADVSKQGLTVNYSGVGSSTGRRFYIINQIDFAASEIPFQPDEVAQLNAEHKSYQYLPDVAGGTSFMYNLHNPDGSRKTDLQLSSASIAGIFTGSITDWDDPSITADNGGHPLPSEPIKPVIRADGSGTSAQFSLYLAAVQPSIWDPFAQEYGITAPASYWPIFPGAIAQTGSDGVANFISNDSVGRGSIGYVEYGYATEHGFPAAMVRNASGHYVLPLSNNVATALTHATINADLTQNLTKVYVAPEANAYPVSSYSYMITQTTGFDPAKGNVLGQFILYAACAGQQKSALLGYSPLPENLVLADFDAVRRIPGAPAPPALSDCDNPTIGGGGGNGGGGDNGGGGGSNNGAGSSDQAAPGSGPAAAQQGSSTSEGPAVEAAGSASFPPGVTPIPTGDLSRYRAEALRSVRSVHQSSGLPFALAALAVLLLVFGPVLSRRASGKRRRGGGPTGAQSTNL